MKYFIAPHPDENGQCFLRRKFSMSREINFAIVGCGRIAQQHARHASRLGRLVATCDTEITRAESLAANTGATPFCCIDKMLRMAGDIDVVSICTPNGLHASHAIESLSAGCHVLCEKPMAISSSDCGAMIEAAERANRRLFVVKQNRFNPPVVAVKRLIDEGRLGPIHSVQLNCFWNRNADYYKDSWKGTLDLDGGCLYTQFSHFVDLLYWLVGDVRSVAAFADNFCHQGIIEFEDCGVVVLRFRSGAIGCIHFTINAYRENMEGSLTIFGERGTVKVGGRYLNEINYQNIEGYEIPELSPGRPANHYDQYQGSMSNHGLVYENVVDVLTNNGVVATNSYEGLKTVEIIEKCYESIRRGRRREQHRSPVCSSATTPR